MAPSRFSNAPNRAFKDPSAGGRRGALTSALGEALISNHCGDGAGLTLGFARLAGFASYLRASAQLENVCHQKGSHLSSRFSALDNDDDDDWIRASNNLLLLLFARLMPRQNCANCRLASGASPRSRLDLVKVLARIATARRTRRPRADQMDKQTWPPRHSLAYTRSQCPNESQLRKRARARSDSMLLTPSGWTAGASARNSPTRLLIGNATSAVAATRRRATHLSSIWPIEVAADFWWPTTNEAAVLLSFSLITFWLGRSF